MSDSRMSGRISNSRKPHILVLDANQRSALAVTRSLGKSKVDVSTADSSIASLAGCSKYSLSYHQYPSPEQRPADFLEWIEGTCSQYKFDAIFPTTEITSQLLLMNKTGLGTCVLPFPDYQTVMSLADKGKLLTSAGAAGIPVPDYRLFNKAAEVAVEEFTSFPVVLKPCLSRIWTGQGWINTSVTMINNREELSRTLDRTDYLQRYPFMIQAFVPGHGAGLFALYDSGQPVAYFSHRRIREKPPRGGVSVVSESAPVDTQLQEYAEALLTRANWHGVAMVEFRVTDRGLPYLMEVNTRFWGSLQLAIDAGVDFPRLLWEITAGQAIEPQSEYRIGQRLRWLLGDLDSLYLALKDRDYSARQKLERLVGFLTPSFGHFRYEVNRWGDLKPAWFELRQYVKDLVR